MFSSVRLLLLGMNNLCMWQLQRFRCCCPYQKGCHKGETTLQVLSCVLQLPRAGIVAMWFMPAALQALLPLWEAGAPA